MIIRPATSPDIEKIAVLYIKNHRETYKNLLPDTYFDRLTYNYAEEKWNTYLNTADRKIWVAYNEDDFLGFSAGMKDEELTDTWYLDSLHITEKARGKGIGTALIKTMMKYAAENNCSKMTVCIVRGNDNAGSLYKKLGAVHFSYFDDDFCDTVSHSEKLLWNDLSLIKDNERKGL